MAASTRREPSDIASLTVQGAIAAATGRHREFRDARAALGDRAASLGREVVEVAAGHAFCTVLARNWDGGWQPLEIARQVRRSRRRLDPGLLGAGMGAAGSWRDAGSEMPEVWASQLRELGVTRAHHATAADTGSGTGTGTRTGTGNRAGATNWLGDWTLRSELTFARALPALLETLGVLTLLPSIEPLLPRPREWGRQVPVRTGQESDDPMLAKIRALLAKAESTTFGPEAEALTGKAQELMARHSIDDALARAERGDGQLPVARRIAVDDPYVTAKTSLLQVVSDANGVRCVFYRDFAMMALVGFRSDLDTVETLFTSLLLQASRAMLAQGSAFDGQGVSRTRSFRQSFLLAFAGRIRERLAAAASNARLEAEGELGTSLVPVLARRDGAVVVGAMFPTTARAAGPSARNRAGWLAGQEAAERASLGSERTSRKRLDATG